MGATNRPRQRLGRVRRAVGPSGGHQGQRPRAHGAHGVNGPRGGPRGPRGGPRGPRGAHGPTGAHGGPRGRPTGPTGSMTSSPCRKIQHAACYERLTDDPPGLPAPLSLPSTHHSSPQPINSECSWTHKPFQRHFVSHPPKCPNSHGLPPPLIKSFIKNHLPIDTPPPPAAAGPAPLPSTHLYSATYNPAEDHPPPDSSVPPQPTHPPGARKQPASRRTPT